jgi:hypothetical protein
MPSTIPIPETSYLRICHAASQLNCADRAAFAAAVREALGDQPADEGAIARAVAVAFRAYWRAPQLPMPQGPRLRAYYGSPDKD